MPYFKDSKTFTQLIDENIPLEKKIIIIEDIIKQLKQFHDIFRRIFLCDIQLDNLIANDRGHIIDLDGSNVPGQKKLFPQCFGIRNNCYCQVHLCAGCNVDNIKSVICFLSLIYNIDLSRRYVNLNDLKEVISSCLSKEQKEYIDECFVLENKSIYFDEIINTFND